ncbi:hypothetical protein JXA40_04515 [bacterium]|nr:hypothetical protein [candidate division CSSED10-310 bacterium]
MSTFNFNPIFETIRPKVFNRDTGQMMFWFMIGVVRMDVFDDLAEEPLKHLCLELIPAANRWRYDKTNIGLSKELENKTIEWKMDVIRRWQEKWNLKEDWFNGLAVAQCHVWLNPKKLKNRYLLFPGGFVDPNSEFYIHRTINETPMRDIPPEYYIIASIGNAQIEKSKGESVNDIPEHLKLKFEGHWQSYLDNETRTEAKKRLKGEFGHALEQYLNKLDIEVKNKNYSTARNVSFDLETFIWAVRRKIPSKRTGKPESVRDISETDKINYVSITERTNNLAKLIELSFQ